MTCLGWMSVVVVERRWPRNGHLIGHVANEQASSFAPSCVLKQYLTLVVSSLIHTYIALWIFRSRLKGDLWISLKSKLYTWETVLLCNVWERSSPNRTPMITVQIVTLQCSHLCHTLQVSLSSMDQSFQSFYHNTLRAAVKYQNCVFWCVSSFSHIKGKMMKTGYRSICCNIRKCVRYL